MTAPATATFTVTTTGSAVPTYQWQVSTDSGATFTDINGASAATYTTPATVTTDSGKKFRVVVSNGTNRITSSIAQLRVTTPQLLTGIVVAGRPMAGASVAIHCVDGSKYTGQTASNGSFDIAIDSQVAAAFPCMLRAGIPPEPSYHSYAETSGQVNINPLTDLTLAKALKASPAASFDNFGASSNYISKSELADAPQFIVAAMELTSGYRTLPQADFKTPNPFTRKFAIGDDIDQLLVAFAASLKQSDLTFDAYRDLIIAHASERTGFEDIILNEAVIKRVVPEVDTVECDPPELGRKVKCVLKGRKLTRPGSYLTRQTSDLGLVLSKNSEQIRPKQDPTRPFKPAWCEMSGHSSYAIYTSTDSTDPYGPDPLGMYAEEIIFTCENNVANADKITAEVVLYDHIEGEQQVHNWPLFGPHTEVTPPVPLGTATLDSVTCASKILPGYEFVHSSWVDLQFSGTLNLGTNQMLSTYVAGGPLSPDQVRGLATRMEEPTGIKTDLISLSCGALCFGPTPLSTFYPAPDYDVVSVKSVFADPYIAQTVWVYAIVNNLLDASKVNYAEASVQCPAHGRPQ